MRQSLLASKELKKLTNNRNEDGAKLRRESSVLKDDEETAKKDEIKDDKEEGAEKSTDENRDDTGVSAKDSSDDSNEPLPSQTPEDDGSEKKDDDDDDDNESKSGPAHQTRVALDHFKALNKFIVEYIGPELRKFQLIKKAFTEGSEEGIITKISFPDLWMLYQPGSTIYCASRAGGTQKVRNSENDDSISAHPKRTPQAYRILATSGGMLTGASFGTAPGYPTAYMYDLPPAYARKDQMLEGEEEGTPSWMRVKERYSDLVVHCYYIDYDSKKWSAVPDGFIFRPFEGEVDISTLEAYPLTPGQEIWNAMKERGKRFINMTLVSYCEYDGLTVGGSQDREEVYQSRRNRVRGILIRT